MLKPKPWWLRLLTKKYTWVTIAPHIYHPLQSDPTLYPGVVVHETVHLQAQQAMGTFTWFYNYFVHASFRFDQEVRGMAAELRTYREPLRTSVLDEYATDLAGDRYTYFFQKAEEDVNWARTILRKATDG
jgi:hypothetical protein